jgi:hypothetical protein
VTDEDEWNWDGTYDLSDPEPSLDTVAPAMSPVSTEPVILDCGCGRQLKAPRAIPGTKVQCPTCGTTVRVPEETPPPRIQAAVEDEWNWEGVYDLDAVPPKPDPAPPPTDDVSTEAEAEESPRAVASEPEPDPWAQEARPRAREPVPSTNEAWWPPHLLYPLRGAESLMMVASLGVAFWVLATLAVEYCLSVFADAEKLGTPSMGRLVALISFLPTLILMPLVVVYWLQYLSRVLAAGASGETLPPRPPDRNFDGLFNGLERWLLWLALGVVVGFLPLAAYMVAVSQGTPWDFRCALGVGILGLPYAVMALLRIFLREDPLATTPTTVIGAMLRRGWPFLGVCLITAALLGLGLGVVAALLWLRSASYWIYVPASLPCWCLAVWISIVMMFTLGTYNREAVQKARGSRRR